MWTTGTPAQLQVLVVNEHGVAVAETAVQVTVEQLQIKAAQVKGAGNAYLPRYVRSWSEVATCALVSEMTPGTCTFTPPAPGTYRLTASITDTRGRTHHTSIRRWATGAGEVLWETSPDHNLHIISEQKGYKVGDTARYLVQHLSRRQGPGDHERFGVQRSWLETLNEATASRTVSHHTGPSPGFLFVRARDVAACRETPHGQSGGFGQAHLPPGLCAHARAGPLQGTQRHRAASAGSL